MGHYGHPPERDIGACARVVNIVVVEPEAHEGGFRQATYPGYLGGRDVDVLARSAVKHAEVAAMPIEHPGEDDEPFLCIQPPEVLPGGRGACPYREAEAAERAKKLVVREPAALPRAREAVYIGERVGQIEVVSCHLNADRAAASAVGWVEGEDFWHNSTIVPEVFGVGKT